MFIDHCVVTKKKKGEEDFKDCLPINKWNRKSNTQNSTYSWLKC